jgi:hypothetical protein
MSPRRRCARRGVNRKIGGDRLRGNRFFLFTRQARAHGRDQTMPEGFGDTASPIPRAQRPTRRSTVQAVISLQTLGGGRGQSGKPVSFIPPGCVVTAGLAGEWLVGRSAGPILSTHSYAMCRGRIGATRQRTYATNVAIASSTTVVMAELTSPRIR